MCSESEEQKLIKNNQHTQRRLANSDMTSAGDGVVENNGGCGVSVLLW